MSEMAWDVLSGVTKLHGMFYPGGKSSWDVLSGVSNGMGCFVTVCFVRLAENYVKRGSCMEWEIESAHAWILKILCFLIVWGITLIFMLV